MRREGRARGKPTSKSRVKGRCSGRRRRRDHSERLRDRDKRFAADVRINPSLTEFCLQPSPKQLRVRDVGGRRIDERWSVGDHADEGAVQVGIYAATVNSVIEAAFERMHRGCGDAGEMDATAAMAGTVFELASGAIVAGDGTDIIPAIEEAFHRELGIFENAVEGSSFSETHFARKWGCVLSEESWSDVELLESELESSDDDDWLVVLDGEDDV